MLLHVIVIYVYVRQFNCVWLFISSGVKLFLALIFLFYYCCIMRVPAVRSVAVPGHVNKRDESIDSLVDYYFYLLVRWTRIQRGRCSPSAHFRANQFKGDYVCPHMKYNTALSASHSIDRPAPHILKGSTVPTQTIYSYSAHSIRRFEVMVTYSCSKNARILTFLWF